MAHTFIAVLLLRRTPALPNPSGLMMPMHCLYLCYPIRPREIILIGRQRSPLNLVSQRAFDPVHEWPPSSAGASGAEDLFP